MPQMYPMNWLILPLMFLSIFLLVTIFLFFIPPHPTLTTFNTSQNLKSLWSW